ncbi:hypothetical protein E8E12_010900 [Didymella heteroderae]|uniref:C2H2-type domain-containing protein n=1 Tax=Didymella heteroderae TaxID=1769908 RepID=A0A9P5C7H3_9PLEO|nr:hypothetical protein E8E12_010900 [Didymella heteroderae]
MARAPTGKTHTCGRCERNFDSRQELSKHLQNHPDSEPEKMRCKVCNWPFDSLALERHIIGTGHSQDVTPPQFKCDRCTQTFSTQREYQRHRELGKPCSDDKHSKDWKKKPRATYIDLDKPQLVGRDIPQLAYGSDTPDTSTVMSQDGVHCEDCKKCFVTMHAYSSHFLSCQQFNEKLTLVSLPAIVGTTEQDQNLHPTPPISQRHTMTLDFSAPHIPTATALAGASYSMPLQTMILNTRAPMPHPPPAPPNDIPAPSSARPVRPQAWGPPQESTLPSASAKNFICHINGCTRSYGSEVGLKIHKTDAHGIGGQVLDLHGKDSWMLSQRERERLRAGGLLRPSPGSRGGRGGGRGGRPAPALPIHRPPPPHATAQRAYPAPGPYHQSSHNSGTSAPPPLPTSQNIGGALEMKQAKAICGKTLRLLLQTDIFIHHDGKMSVGGIDWTRIGVARQPDVAGMFNDMCHLPRKLQTLEYVPAPKTFAAEYTAQYSVTEFESAPARNRVKPALDIISMSCSKITLSNGCQEVVKIAAVDVLTCRVLMSHLVCTDPDADVANWHSSVTGLSCYKDMEDARQAGYKVIKGWATARSALFKFIDKETIIVGHNLRSELDALRIIHGRAVDIAKVVEKAAQGPLSKAQVSLDSWCRDVANVATLKTDPVFGRDCVMDSFAARGIGLWTIKNKENFEKVAKQKTKDYQTVMKN